MAVTFEESRNEIFAWDEANRHLDVVTRDGLILERIFSECPIKGRPHNTFFYDNGFFVAHGLVFRRRKSSLKLKQADKLRTDCA